MSDTVMAIVVAFVEDMIKAICGYVLQRSRSL